MPYSAEDLRAAKIRYAAKRFADRLRSDRWAESIPEDDVQEYSDAELTLYKQTLIARGCVQRPDYKWEAK